MITLSSGFVYIGLVLSENTDRGFEVAWYMGETTGYYKTTAIMSEHIQVLGTTPSCAEWDIDEHF